MTRALIPNPRRGLRKPVVNLSSQPASIERSNGQTSAWRAGKMALNPFSKIPAARFGPRGFEVLVLHPGWVHADNGGANAKPRPSIAWPGCSP